MSPILPPCQARSSVQSSGSRSRLPPLTTSSMKRRTTVSGLLAGRVAFGVGGLVAVGGPAELLPGGVAGGEGRSGGPRAGKSVRAEEKTGRRLVGVRDSQNSPGDLAGVAERLQLPGGEEGSHGAHSV